MPDPRLARPLWRGRQNVDAFTIACIEHAEAIVRERWPEIAHPFNCTQGSYQGDSGDPDSGTTHRLGGAVDLDWCGHPQCYLALRLAGMFIWHRTPDQGDWDDHFHGAPLGHPLMDYRLAAQATSYLARGNGLGGSDDGPRLDPIPRPVWPWPQENLVTPEDIKAIAAETTKQLLDSPIADDGRTVRKALRQASKASGLEDAIVKRVQAALLSEPGDVAVTVTAEQIEDAVKAALREGTDS